MRSNSVDPRGWDARLSSPGSPVCTPDWLALREPADAAARDPELAVLLAARLSRHPGEHDPLVIRDLGCGTGSLGRWLAPQLPGPQHWLLHDRDTTLLDRAADGLPGRAADGTSITTEPQPGDLTGLDAAQLTGTSLITASALLDLLTADEVSALAGACVEARCPALFTLSVAGRVSFSPADPLDDAIGEAFNAHQRRTVAGRRLLGPDAIDATSEAFARFGAETVVRPSLWRLAKPGDAALIAAWLEGWVGAAAEQDPSLPVGDYLQRRLEADDLSVVVEHGDLFVVL